MRTTLKNMLVISLSLGLGCSAIAQTRTITNQLVVHLSFDNTLADDSGRGNNAAYVNSNGLSIFPSGPTYVSGKLGQGFQFNVYPDASLIEYATLGYPNDLKFGTASDFSMAFWFKTYSTNIVGGSDPALLSNRDWNSGGTRGFGIFLQGGLTTIRHRSSLDTTGTNTTTQTVSVRPATPGGENLYDGNFHHIAVVYQRAVSIKTYVDGALENTTATSAVGSYDTYTNLVGALQVPENINIGEDGTGCYTQGSGNNPPANAGSAGVTNAVVDDVGIWRRALTDLEVSSIYNFAQGGTNLYSVPDVHTPIVTAFAPPNSASGVSPIIPVSATIQDQNTAVNTNTLLLLVDGVSVAFTLSHNNLTNIITYTQPFLAAPGSTHTNRLIFADNNTPTANRFTNVAVYSIIQWSNIYLPPPIYFENFDEVTPATNTPSDYPTDVTGTNYPSGWSASNCTTLFGTWDILVPSSDVYANFRPVPIDIIVHNFNYDSRILNFNSPIILNGVLITNTMASNNIVFAASDQRPNGPQIDYLFTKDYDLTGKTNVWLAYWNMWSQENGQLGSVEYSFDQGANWLPIVYMIDPRSAIFSGGVLDPLATMTNYFTRVQPDACNGNTGASGFYGDFVGVAPNLWFALGPYISLRAGSDHVTWHTVEKFRLPFADGQATVRFRFAFSGRDYWDWGFDNFGLYSITDEPLVITNITKSGATVTINWNGTGANSASGLQKTTRLSPPTWVNIPGTIGQSSYSEAASPSGAYYRAVRY